MGGIWTVMIVCQIAVTVVAPVVAVAVHLDSLNERREIVLPLDDADYLTARIELDREAGMGADAAPGSTAGATDPSVDFGEAYRARLEQLREALTADPRVAGVTFAECLRACTTGGARSRWKAQRRSRATTAATGSRPRSRPTTST